MLPNKLASAVEHHKAGRLGDAEAAYRAILEEEPRNADALHLLGLIEAAHGRTIEAVSLVARAVAESPSNVAALFNLGKLRFDAGDARGAIEAYEAAVALAPQDAGIHVNLGNAYRGAGRLGDAVASYDRALTIAPGSGLALLNKGVVLVDAGLLDDAAVAFQSALTAGAPAETYLANALRRLDRGEEAERLCEATLQRSESPELRIVMGQIATDRGDYAAALSHFRRALELAPQSSDALFNLAVHFYVAGEKDESERFARKALAHNPHHAAALRLVTNLGRVHAGDALATALDSIVTAADVPIPDRVEAEFALGKVFAGAGIPERAFGHYASGNALNRKRLHYDESGTLAYMDALQRAFTKERIEAATGGDPTPVPVFVVGMPRSGTTLVEQILASHPGVFGAGESPALERTLRAVFPGDGLPVPERLATADASQLREIASKYLSEVRRLAPNASRIVDKTTSNVWYAGVVAMALPNATIVHTCRDAVDTCWSCFTQLFTGRDQTFAYDLSEIGRYYRAYQRLVSHWREALPPGMLIDVEYERLVDDFDAQARRVVAHVGLEWDDACARFHETKRAVRTASAVQVREPIYRSSVGGSGAYARFLGPLMKELGT